MMTDYQVGTNSRRCCVSGRELQPGEKYYTTLVEEAGKLVRRDYAADAWTGSPKDAFSFWSGRVPPSGSRRRPQMDDELLLDCFVRLEDQTEPARIRFRYVLSLLLMRRRRLRFEEAEMDGPLEVLVLRCSRGGARHRVTNPGLTDEELAGVQDDVFQALGWD
jgi:hypothetical protein